MHENGFDFSILSPTRSSSYTMNIMPCMNGPLSWICAERNTLQMKTRSVIELNRLALLHEGNENHMSHHFVLSLQLAFGLRSWPSSKSPFATFAIALDLQPCQCFIVHVWWLAFYASPWVPPTGTSQVLLPCFGKGRVNPLCLPVLAHCVLPCSATWVCTDGHVVAALHASGLH